MNTIVEKANDLERITELALRLAPNEQSLLLARLHDNLEALGRDPEHEAAWAAEIERRVREIENGEAELVDHETVMREAFERLARR